MIHLSIKEIVGTAAITLSDGEVIYSKLSASFDEGEVVELDFDGVSVFASPFFNAGIGKLLSVKSDDYLNSHLKVKNLSSVGMDVLRRVIANAKDYYAKPTEQRNEIGEIVNRDSDS